MGAAEKLDSQYTAFLTDLEGETGMVLPDDTKARLRGSFARNGYSYSPYLTSNRMSLDLDELPALTSGRGEVFEGTAVEEPAELPAGKTR